MSETSERKALITGITGQDGSYLAELLLAKGYRVWGVIRRSSIHNTPRIDHLLRDEANQGRLNLAWGDLGDSSSLHRLLGEVEPDEIYNLAAQSDVKISFDTPEETGNASGLGVVRLLEGIREHRLDSRFYQAASSEMYGKVLETPQRETTPFYPRSPYAVAKTYAFHMTRNYREAYGTFAVNGILFNHESPRRGENFVTRKITKAVARIARGHEAPLHLGNLDARRDWGFAGDYVEAMWLILQAEKADDYVIATGESYSVRDFCERAFAHVGLSLQWEGEGLSEKGIDENGRVLVDVDPAFFRPSEVDVLIGDATRAREELGWKPKTSFEDLVAMMVRHDLEALR